MDDDTRPRGWPERSAPPPDDWVGHHVSTLDLDTLYRTQSTRLDRYFARRTARDDVRDLVHDTFRRLAALGPSARAAIRQPEAYLTRIAGNLLRDREKTGWQNRDACHEPHDDTRLAGPDPHHQLEVRDHLARIDAAMLKLKPKTREIFQLHRLDGLDYAEIAEVMGMSVSGVEKQMIKALSELRRRAGPR